MKRTLSSLLAFSIAGLSLFAQEKSYRLTSLALDDLSAFSSPGANWAIGSGIKAAYTDTVFSVTQGKGVLVNNVKPSDHSGKNLVTNFTHGDMYIELDYNVPKGSNSGIYFQGRYEVQIYDSWGVQRPKVYDNGSIYERWDEGRAEGRKGYEGHPALVNASFAPGLWQHLEALFQAPRFDAAGKKISDARFLFVKLNGITIHENIILHGPTRAAMFNDEAAVGPIMIQGDHGQVAIRNIKYAPQNELKVALKDLTYKYYEGNFENEQKAFATKPTREGKTDYLDSRLADARNGYALAFDGKLEVPEQDNYFFTMLYSGEGTLEIDGKPVINKKSTWIFADPLTGSAELSAGTHQLKLWYNKQVNWQPPGLSLFIQKPNSKAVALHTTSSMPERRNSPLIAVESLKGPEMVRSFQFRGDKKLTHVMSVGSPSEVNYSYNLLQGGLLQVWKGDFLNVTEMWYQRGEPQISVPMGAPLVLSGIFPVLTDPAALVDSVAGLAYKGYRINAQGYPEYFYDKDDFRIVDIIQPFENNKGIERSINIANAVSAPKISFRIAEGKNLVPLGNGLYAADDQSYYVKLISAPAAQPAMLNSNGKQVMTVPAVNGAVKYAIIW